MNVKPPAEKVQLKDPVCEMTVSTDSEFSSVDIGEVREKYHRAEEEAASKNGKNGRDKNGKKSK